MHATEFDRSGEHVHQPVYDLERAGVHAADRVLAVSGLTRDVLVSRYGVPAEKIQVVHNGMVFADDPGPVPALRERRRTVLFLGRVTRQKGPGFFLAAAERVLEHVDDARFIIAGNGDLMPSMIERVAADGLGAQILFTGFLGQAEVAQAYRQADVYVMPSVSEPFGLTALEAVRHGTPTIISRTSGVAEVLRRGALQVDHWDVDGMANGIIAILKHPALAETLCLDGREELRGLSWGVAAAKCHQAYRELVPGEQAGADGYSSGADILRGR